MENWNRGDNYNKIINDLIVEHNINKFTGLCGEFIKEDKIEFVSIDNL